MAVGSDNRPALDRWLARLFDDERETGLGSGWISGTVAVFLGVVAVGAVAHRCPFPVFPAMDSAWASTGDS